LRLPFTIIVSYLDDSHLGTTRKFIEVKHNVPIDDAMFEHGKMNEEEQRSSGKRRKGKL